MLLRCPRASVSIVVADHTTLVSDNWYSAWRVERKVEIFAYRAKAVPTGWAATQWARGGSGSQCRGASGQWLWGCPELPAAAGERRKTWSPYGVMSPDGEAIIRQSRAGGLIARLVSPDKHAHTAHILPQCCAAGFWASAHAPRILVRKHALVIYFTKPVPTYYLYLPHGIVRPSSKVANAAMQADLQVSRAV